jgi:hypothetical protein
MIGGFNNQLPILSVPMTVALSPRWVRLWEELQQEPDQQRLKGLYRSLKLFRKTALNTLFHAIQKNNANQLYLADRLPVLIRRSAAIIASCPCRLKHNP